ncbi:hypothetical protein [Maribacter sp. 2307ULW6-5]|uniref:hypothetical protein n=1 Tax=Maribacter sp. 2307ULW6-5 TaxID=3386275 RepID=UPI0039BC6EE0
MGVVASLEETTADAAQRGKAYLDTTKEYYELKGFKVLTVATTKGSTYLFYGLLLLMAVLFFAISAALALTLYLESAPLGFLLVGCCFVLLMLVVRALRKPLARTLIKKLSKNYFEE